MIARTLQCGKIEVKWKSGFIFFKKKKGGIRFQQNMAPLGQKKTRVDCRERGPDDTEREGAAVKRLQILFDKI